MTLREGTAPAWHFFKDPSFNCWVKLGKICATPYFLHVNPGMKFWSFLDKKFSRMCEPALQWDQGKRTNVQYTSCAGVSTVLCWCAGKFWRAEAHSDSFHCQGQSKMQAADDLPSSLTIDYVGPRLMEARIWQYPEAGESRHVIVLTHLLCNLGVLSANSNNAHAVFVK